MAHSRLLLLASLWLVGCGKDSASCRVDCGTDASGGAESNCSACSESGTTGEGAAPTQGGVGVAGTATGGFAGESGISGAAGSGGSSNSGGGVGGEGTDCRDERDCDDANPCTVDECDGTFSCRHNPRADGEACNDGSPCTDRDHCDGAVCVGEPKSSTGALGASVFSYGTEPASGVDGSGGPAIFLSDERAVFADRLDGSGTVLSVVRRQGRKLAMEAQGVTATQMLLNSYSAQVWQSHWINYLTPVSGSRFAFADVFNVMQVLNVDGSEIREVARYKFDDHASALADAVTSADGQIWTCAGLIQRFRIASDGSVEPRPSVTLPENALGCHSMTLAADGQTLFASTSAGIVRFVAASGHEVTAELVLPGVTALSLAANAEHLMLQRVAKFGDFGAAELYRLADGSLVASRSQSVSRLPFGIGLVAGEAVTMWREGTTGDKLTELLHWGDATSGSTEHGLELRSREAGLDAWAANYERLSVQGRQVLMQPWRRWLELSADHASFQQITGPGQGTLGTLVASNAGTAFALGTYAQQTISLSDPSALRFSAGGLYEPGAAPQPLQLAVPSERLPESSFQGRSPPLEQRAARERVTLFEVQDDQLIRLGDALFAGGPAQLLPRERTLFQISAEDEYGFRLREYELSAELVGGSQPAAPMRELVLNMASSLPHRHGFVVDVDAQRAEAVIVERRSDSTVLGEAVPRFLAWVSWRTGELLVLARAELEADARLPVLALRGGKLLLWDGPRHWSVQLEDGTLKMRAAPLPVDDASVQALLGLDGAERAYVSAQNGARTELWVFDFDATLRSRFTLPGAGVAMVQSGDQLLVSTKGSVHRLHASCGDVQPTDPSDWPVVDPPEPDPGPNECLLLEQCRSWSPPAQTGDVNRDGCVDSADMAMMVDCYTQPTDPCRQSVLADLDGNGLVDDYPAVINNFGKGCSAP
jgi:hypothetical protein